MHSKLTKIIDSREKSFKKQSRINYEKNASKRPRLFNTLSELSSKAVAIIAEIKTASPSRGNILSNVDEIGDRIRAYQAANVQGISILTEPEIFNGSYDHLQLAVRETSLPILCKDFNICKGQLEFASTIGASAALIIAKVKKSLELIGTCLDLGMEPLLEIHDFQDLEKITPIVRRDERIRLIGINNRDLNTMKVDLNIAKELLPKAREMLGDHVYLISESGIYEKHDIKALHEIGAEAFLIGSSLMDTPTGRIKQKINSLREI